MTRGLIFVYERVPAAWMLSLNIEGCSDLLLGPETYDNESAALVGAAEFQREYQQRMDLSVLKADPRQGDPFLYWVRWGEDQKR